MAIAQGIGAAINVLSNSAAAESERQAALSGAQANADIVQMGIGSNDRLFREQQLMSQPYLDYGYQGVEGLGAGGDYNFRGTPEYGYMKGLGNSAIEGMQGVSPDVLQYAQKQFGQNLDLQEQDNAYNRLLDAVYIGQGQAGLAGGQAQQYGSALSNAYQNIGNMNLAAQRMSGQSQQNTMNTVLGQASSIPAYMAQSNYFSGLGQTQSQDPNVYGGQVTNGGGYKNMPSYLMR